MKSYMKKLGTIALLKEMQSRRKYSAGKGTQAGGPKGPNNGKTASTSPPAHPICPIRMLVIRGPHNCGKTSSISNAFYRLIHLFTPVGVGQTHPHQGLNVEFFYFSRHPHQELTAIFKFDKYTNKKLFNQKFCCIRKLGVATRGDNAGQLQDTLDLFMREGCDAVIIACSYTPIGIGQAVWTNTVWPHPLTQRAIQLGNLTVFDYQAAPANANINGINHLRGTGIIQWV